MFWELILILLAILIILDYFHKKKRNEIFKTAGIRGPRPLPLLGNVLDVAGNDTARVFRILQGISDKYGKVWHMWFFHENVFFVRDPKYFESILSSQEVLTKNVLYDLLREWLGDGLLVSRGAKWHRRRKIITPTFHFKILEQFVDVFDQQSQALIEKLNSKADGKTTVDIFPVICLTALDIIAESAMGVKIHAQERPDFPYAKAVTNAANIIATRFMKVDQRFEFVFRLKCPREAGILNESIEIMHNFTDKVIKERRSLLEKSLADGSYKSTAPDINDVGVKKRMAFLDVLLQSTVDGKPLSDQDIREEVDTFMFEGHDTTTSGISFTCYLISRHPEVQAKLFQEIRQVIGDDKNKSICMRDLQELKYLECVIKEGLRLYPPVPMIGRITKNNVELNGKIIPGNTNYTLLLYAALRDPDYFSNPHEFVPERFSSENVDQINPFAYVPFSAGPRNCIGQKFALLEMKSTISKILRHFELLPLGAEVQPVMNLIMRSSNGINLGLRPRVY